MLNWKHDAVTRWCAVAAMVAVMGVPAWTRAQGAPPITGFVFVDANGNGVRDAGEAGVGGVAVSNQDTVVTSNALGAYKVQRRGLGLLFVSVPNGYRAVGSFYRTPTDTTRTSDFPLARIPAAGTFTFVHASDTHIAPASVGRTRRLRVLVDSLHPAFLLITGDLVRDALRVGEEEATGYYALFAQEVAAFHTPLWTIPGNHENFGIETTLSKVSPSHPLFGKAMYRHYRGPDYYSFNYGGVHFVGLNTVDIDDQSYYGHVDSLQMAWLERDLAPIAPSTPVVTFDHIPFYSSLENMGGYQAGPPAPSLITVHGKTQYRHTVSNAAEVLAILRTRQHVLALGGHFHAVERLDYEVDGLHTRFAQAAAVVAPTERGGVRFPSGITLYTVRSGVIDAGRFISLGAGDDSKH